MQEHGLAVLRRHQVQTTQIGAYPDGVAIGTEREDAVVGQATGISGVVLVMDNAVAAALRGHHVESLPARTYYYMSPLVGNHTVDTGQNGLGGTDRAIGRQIAYRTALAVAQQHAAVVVGLPDAAVTVAVDTQHVLTGIEQVVLVAGDDIAAERLVLQHGPDHALGCDVS